MRLYNNPTHTNSNNGSSVNKDLSEEKSHSLKSLLNVFEYNSSVNSQNKTAPNSAKKLTKTHVDAVVASVAGDSGDAGSGGPTSEDDGDVGFQPNLSPEFLENFGFKFPQRRSTPSFLTSLIKEIEETLPEVHISEREELSVSDLHALSSVDNGKDMAEINSENYLSENMMYFLDEKYRSLTGRPKPVLSPERQKLVSNKMDQDWYKEVSKLWLSYGLGTAKDHKNFNINTKLLSNDLSLYFQKLPFTRQTTLLYHYAYVERVPKMKAYITDKSGNWAQQYKDFLLGNEFLDNWNSAVKVVSPSVIQLLLKEITSKLDMLDPTTETSREVTLQLSLNQLAREVFEDLDDIKTQAIYAKTLEKVLRDSAYSEQTSEDMEFLRQAIEFTGNVADLASMFLHIFTAIPKSEVVNSTSTQQLGNSIWERMKTWPAKLKEIFQNKKIAFNWVKRVLGSFFVTAALCSIVVGLSRWEYSSVLEKIRDFTNLGSLVLVIASKVHYTESWITDVAGKAGNFLSQWFKATSAGKWLGKLSGGKVLSGIGKTIEVIFTKRFKDVIARRLVPILVLATSGLVIEDIIHDIDEENWGALSFDIAFMISSIGEGILLLANFAAWTGIVGGILFALGIIFLIIKLTVFPDKTDDEKLHDSLDKKYKRDWNVVELPAGVNRFARIRLADHHDTFICPDPEDKSPSHLKLTNNGSPDINRFQVIRMGQGQISLVNPFNVSAKVNESMLSTDNGHLSVVSTKQQPNEKQVFTLIDSGKPKSFYIMSWDSKFLHVNVHNQYLELSDDRTAFEFTEDPDYLDPINGLSLFSGFKLNVGQSIIGGGFGLVPLEDGVYCINLPPLIDNDNNPLDDLPRYIREYPNAIAIELFTHKLDRPLGPKGYVTVNASTSELEVYDSDGKIIPSKLPSPLVPKSTEIFREPKVFVLGPYITSDWVWGTCDIDWKTMLSHL